MGASAPNTPVSHGTAAWSVREIFRKWEVLRLVYNGVLIVESLAFAIPLLWRVPIGPFILNAVLAALAANVCFLLGPAVESYVRWLGWHFRGLRHVLFAAGLLFSMYVVLLVFAPIIWAVYGLD